MYGENNPVNYVDVNGLVTTDPNVLPVDSEKTPIAGKIAGAITYVIAAAVGKICPLGGDLLNLAASWMMEYGEEDAYSESSTVSTDVGDFYNSLKEKGYRFPFEEDVTINGITYTWINPGSTRQNAEVIAGGKTGREIDKIDKLINLFGGKKSDWTKRKNQDDTVHWYEKGGNYRTYGGKWKGQKDNF